MQIKSFHEPGSGTWTHLLADPARNAAAIIDPVWVFDPVSGLTNTEFVDEILQLADQAGLRVEWVLETHAHADHLTAAHHVKQETGAKVACSRGICGVQKNFAKVFNMRMQTDGGQFDRLLDEGDIIVLGDLEIRVMDTPGHTGDSITYLVKDAAFVGDTLFAPSYGTARCDFPGGDAEKLYDSVKKIYALPENTRIFLCHDYPKTGEEPVHTVTVAQSLAENIHINAGTAREDFVNMRTRRDAQLGLPKLILPSLQVNILSGAAPAAEANGVVYLKTPFNRSIETLIGK
jgi:glyoxylase-like metal-dependent hydrolase (beta-lactamase superfamily II)